MCKYYLAVDIGASSGRHIAAWLENGKLMTEEIYRFSNGLVDINGSKCWDVERLFREIKAGMKKSAEMGKIPCSMAVDTWGVDFVLLDENDNIIGDAVGYRDSRTDGMDKEVSRYILPRDLYGRTGIQELPINTIYQLMALKLKNPEMLEKAETFIMLPDYFNFLLTGKKAFEYTNATTTGLVNAKTKDWDYELAELLGFKKELFNSLSMPGTVLGNLSDEVKKEVGFDTTVILAATHDTASAVIAVPSGSESPLYISSGTWSLLGTELADADCSEESRKAGFTNEGGINYRFRYLKNIMGLWMIQCVKKEYGDKYSFSELCEMAAKESGFPSLVDVDDVCFLAPDSMIGAIKDYCVKTGRRLPENPGQVAAIVYNSLAKSYNDSINKMENHLGRRFDIIHIVGGGCNNEYLCRLTAEITGKEVLAGPSEATAAGNVIAQMICSGEILTLKQGREIVRQSFDIKKYEGEKHSG